MGEGGQEVTASLRHGPDGFIVDPARAADLFYGDLAPAEAARAVAQLRPMGLGGGPEVDGRPAWKDRPSTYVVCTADRATPPAAQRAMASRAPPVVEWPTAHSPFLARPADLAALIVAAGSA